MNNKVGDWEKPSRKVDPEVDLQIIGSLITKDDPRYVDIMWFSADKTIDQVPSVYRDKVSRLRVTDVLGVEHETIVVDTSRISLS